MKKQTNPTIEAHLIRGAFYLPLLLAVCAIPFALAQRDTNTRTAAKSRTTAMMNLAAAVAKSDVHAALAGAVEDPRMPSKVDPNLPYDVRPLPPQAPRFPYSSIRTRGPADAEAAAAGKQLSQVQKGTSGPAGVAPGTPTPIAIPGVCGLLVGSGMTLGCAPNGWKPTLATNTVNYTFGSSHTAPNDFALFETHDPWGLTVLKDAITGAGHTYTEFTPAQLTGLDFSQYRVVVLNWDDTFLNDFLADYSPAIPALEAYINAGGVVWVQAAVQGNQGENHPMPFGGQVNGADFVNINPVVDPASPMIVGMPNPVPGNSASHVSYSGFPGAAHIVVISGNNAQPTLYEYRPCQGGTPTPTASPTCTPIVVMGSINTGDPTHVNSLQISGIPQTCPASTSCAIHFSLNTQHYDSYTFENTSGGTRCVTINTHSACGPDTFIFTAAYLGSFDPHSLCTNWIGDSGSIPNPDQAFQVNVDDGQTLVIVVSEVEHPNFGCPSYTVTITGLCGETPRPTPTPRQRPTPRPRPGQ